MDPAGDAAIIAELEQINSTLRIIYSKLSETDTDVYSLGQTVDDSIEISGSYSETIISYLHIFLITAFIILGIVFMCKFAKWIENIICDR